ncbi:hypothetical protein ACHAWX_005695 [Stephanocyclus meneghinianus]
MMNLEDISILPELELDKNSTTPWSPRHQRSLYSNDNYVSYLVDSNGNAYEPYSLAWRYLGLYIDCEIANSTNFYKYYNYNQRKLPEQSNEDGQCERKLLWAAYVDPRYQGNTIEEYQFYDLKNGTWDDSTCLASGSSHRCVRMDCHEPRTQFKLVGVFKETEGMYDFTEQLFKHEGYCIWQGEEDDGVYDTMKEWMEKWPTSCKKLTLPDYYGNTLYVAVHPLPEGNMTLEVYTDNKCTVLSEEVDLESYILMLYSYYGYNQRGQQVAQQYSEAIETWNEKMSIFKICQPCRAYNLFYDDGNEKKEHNHRNRALGGNANDGEGEEQERYNCYDDAGYTNVNQCYKFETKTSLEPAAEEDLSLASDQGTILMIKSNGKVYGAGGYVSPYSASWDFDITPEEMMYITFGSIAVIWIALLFFLNRQHRRKCKASSGSLESTLCGDDNGGDNDSDISDSTKSEFSGMSIYSPPSVVIANTGDRSSTRSLCVESYISQSHSEMKSFESIEEDVNNSKLCYVNYSIRSEVKEVKDERNLECYQSKVIHSISEVENSDIEDTSSAGATYLFCKASDNDELKGAALLEVYHGRSVEECPGSEDGRTSSQPDIHNCQSDMSSFESMNDRAHRLQQWLSRQQELAQRQTGGVRQQYPSVIPDKAKDESALAEALQRVQQRILQHKHYPQESHMDDSAADSTMSGIL